MKSKLVNVIVAWYDDITVDFEQKIPLKWNGEHNLTLGSHNPLTVVFLSGMDRLSQGYIKELKSLGYVLVDGSNIYKQLSNCYTNLNRLGQYEKYCFLRWIVLSKLFEGQQIIHYDGDIIWNATPETIATFVCGKTLVLDGGPAFNVISDPNWFKIYERELVKFTKSQSGYGHDWKGTQFRQKIGSDQDLIEYLIQKNLLPQDKMPKTKYIFAENPLLLEDKMNKNLAFYHMQTDYVHYLNLRYMLAPYSLSNFAPNPLTTSPLILKLIYLFGRLAGRGYASRRKIYEYVFN